MVRPWAHNRESKGSFLSEIAACRLSLAIISWVQGVGVDGGGGVNWYHILVMGYYHN